MNTDIHAKEYLPDEWEDIHCPICGVKQSKLHERFGHRLQYTYVACLKCKNIYQSPRPKYDEKFLKAAYGTYYLFNEKHEYRETKYNNFNKEVLEILTFDKSRSSILDVGCAMGDFLYQAKKHYNSVLGVEIAENMAQHTTSNLQIQVFRIPFETIETSARFSCIHMSHIIEHIPNPNDWLDKTKSLLTSDGILVLCVPNMFSFTRIFKLFLKRIGLRKGKWKNSLRTPDHLFEPTVEGMRFFIKNNGFSMLKIYSYSRSNMTAEGPFAFLFHRVFKLGSNLRLYAKRA